MDKSADKMAKTLQTIVTEATQQYNRNGIDPKDYQSIFEDNLHIYEAYLDNKDYVDLYVNIWLEYAKFDIKAKQRKHAKSVYEKAKTSDEVKFNYKFWIDYANFFQIKSPNSISQKARDIYIEGVKYLWNNPHIWSSFLELEMKYNPTITLYNLKDNVQTILNNTGFVIPYDNSDYINPIPYIPAILNRLFVNSKPLEFPVDLDNIVDYMTDDNNILLIGYLQELENQKYEEIALRVMAFEILLRDLRQSKYSELESKDNTEINRINIRLELKELEISITREKNDFHDKIQREFNDLVRYEQEMLILSGLDGFVVSQSKPDIQYQNHVLYLINSILNKNYRS